MIDLVVVGLGLIGSGALRAAADAGVRVVGIGPDEPPSFADHEGAFASHHDSGRITRRLDPRMEWALLAQRSIEGYAAIEARSGIELHRPAGVVMAELDPARTAAILANARAMAVDVAVGAPGDVAFPGADLLRFPAGSTLVAEGPPAGHIDPRRMRAANLAVARAAGAEVVVDEVVAYRPIEGGWAVETASGVSTEARQVVLAAGPHTDELVGRIGVTVRAESVVLATVDAEEQARLAALPSVLARLEHPRYADCYLVPPTDYPDGSVRLKLGATSAPYRDLPTAADKRSWMRGDAHRDELDDLRTIALGLVPGLRSEAWETKPCLISETASDLPIVDHLAPGLVVATGGNGYAAKSANAIGELAVDLALQGRWSDPELDPDAFRLP